MIFFAGSCRYFRNSGRMHPTSRAKSASSRLFAEANGKEKFRLSRRIFHIQTVTFSGETRWRIAHWIFASAGESQRNPVVNIFSFFHLFRDWENFTFLGYYWGPFGGQRWTGGNGFKNPSASLR